MRSIEPEKLARWVGDEDKVGSEPDSLIPTHPHLHFIAMVKRAKSTKSDGKTEEDSDIDPSKLTDQTWSGIPEDGGEKVVHIGPPPSGVPPKNIT